MMNTFTSKRVLVGSQYHFITHAFDSEDEFVKWLVERESRSTLEMIRNLLSTFLGAEPP